MKLFMRLTCALLLLISVSSCTVTKESYLKKFDSFVEHVKEESPKYDETDWEKAEEKFSQLSGPDYKKFEQALTAQEKLKVAKLIGQYRGLQIKSGFKFLKENIEDAIKGTNNFIDSLKEELQ